MIMINRESILVIAIVLFLWLMIFTMVITFSMTWKQQGRIVKLETQVGYQGARMAEINKLMEPIGPGLETRKGRGR